MTITELICEVVAPSIIAMVTGNTVLTWYLQARFKDKLQKAMVEHEAKTRHGYETQIEDLRSQLSQNNFRFSKVFETTEKTIAHLYELLLPVLDAAEDYTMLMSDTTTEQKQEKIKEFSHRCDAFYKVFRPNKIYVPKQTAKQLNDLVGTTIQMVRVFNRSERLLKTEPLSKDGQEVLEKMDNQVEALKLQLSPLLLQLEDDFQRILGFPAKHK